MTNLFFKSMSLLLCCMLTITQGINATTPVNEFNHEDPMPELQHQFSNDSYLEAAIITPQADQLSIKFKQQINPNVYFKIKSSTGAIHYSGSTHTGKTTPLQLTYSLRDLPPGKYFIQMENEQFFTSLVFEKKDQQNYIALESR